MKTFLASLISTIIVMIVGGAVAANGGDAVQAAAAGKPTPFIKTNPPCGSPGNVYFCVDLKPTDAGPKLITPFQVKMPGKGTAFVAWSGSVYCDVTSVPDINKQFNLVRGVTSTFVDLAITQGQGQFAYNQPGAVSVGDLTESRIPREVGFNQTKKVFLIPVTLSKTFPVNKGSESYQVTVVGRFLEYGSPAFCNINGGSMTVQFYPQ